MSALNAYIQAYFSVSLPEAEEILSYFEERSLPKGGYFCKAGLLTDQLGFMEDGLIREWAETETGEVTKWLGDAGTFVAELSAFLFRQPARMNVQALADCRLHVLTRPAYERLQREVAAWPRLETLFVARCFAALEDRLVRQLSLSAEERYSQFMAQRGRLLNQVPLQYVASMLGMTPETLSRLRRKAQESDARS